MSLYVRLFTCHPVSTIKLAVNKYAHLLLQNEQDTQILFRLKFIETDNLMAIPTYGMLNSKDNKKIKIYCTNPNNFRPQETLVIEAILYNSQFVQISPQDPQFWQELNTNHLLKQSVTLDIISVPLDNSSQGSSTKKDKSGSSIQTSQNIIFGQSDTQQIPQFNQPPPLIINKQIYSEKLNLNIFPQQISLLKESRNNSQINMIQQYQVHDEYSYLNQQDQYKRYYDQKNSKINDESLSLIDGNLIDSRGQPSFIQNDLGNINITNRSVSSPADQFLQNRLSLDQQKLQKLLSQPTKIEGYGLFDEIDKEKQFQSQNLLGSTGVTKKNNIELPLLQSRKEQQNFQLDQFEDKTHNLSSEQLQIKEKQLKKDIETLREDYNIKLNQLKKIDFLNQFKDTNTKPQSNSQITFWHLMVISVVFLIFGAQIKNYRQ